MHRRRNLYKFVGKTIAYEGELFIPIGRLHFLVRSKSEDGYHAVDLQAVDDDWPEGGCTCRGFTVRRECRHVRLIRSYLGLDEV